MAKIPYAEKEEIEAAIGRGIWRWHSVEHSLAFLFSLMTGTTHIGDEAFLPFKLFYAPTNFRTQINMLDVAVKHRVKDEALLVEWKSIYNKLLRVKKWRDAFAHCTVAMDNVRKTHIAMVSPFSSKFDKPTGQMTLHEMERAIESIRQGGIRVANFHAALAGYQKPPPKSD